MKTTELLDDILDQSLKLENAIFDIRESVDLIKQNTALTDLLNRLADTRNWIDGRYAPQIKELYNNVPDLCSAVLRENQ